MSPLLFVLALDPLINELDEEIKGVRINWSEKLNRFIYMDDLKMYINEKEYIENIDNRTIQPDNNICMRINERKSWNEVHGNVITLQSIEPLK